jgi:hypothetical protein
VVRPQVVVAGVTQKITGGKLVHERSVKFCLEAVDDLRRKTRLLSRQEA